MIYAERKAKHFLASEVNLLLEGETQFPHGVGRYDTSSNYGPKVLATATEYYLYFVQPWSQSHKQISL